MNLRACLSLLDELILKMDDIISKGAKRPDSASTDKFRDTAVQMRQLVRSLFADDADKRLKDFDDSLKKAIGRDSLFSFMEQTKVTRRYLVSIKDQLKLRESIETGTQKLDKLKGEVAEKEIEASRREAVAETKFYGAFIELIDRLRDQLKDKGTMEQEIIKMRSELAEIKELLKGITKEPTSKEREASE